MPQGIGGQVVDPSKWLPQYQQNAPAILANIPQAPVSPGQGYVYSPDVGALGVEEAGLGGMIKGGTALFNLMKSLIAPLSLVGGGYAIGEVLGGDEATAPATPGTYPPGTTPYQSTPFEFGGPGLAEPGPGSGWLLLKEWHVSYDWGRLQYYLIQKPGSRGRNTNRYIAMYNTRTKEWKMWRWKSPTLAVIGKNMPRHQMLTRLRRNLSRHKADARTVLKYADPMGYAKAQGYHKHSKRR